MGWGWGHCPCVQCAGSPCVGCSRAWPHGRGPGAGAPGQVLTTCCARVWVALRCAALCCVHCGRCRLRQQVLALEATRRESLVRISDSLSPGASAGPNSGDEVRVPAPLLHENAVLALILCWDSRGRACSSAAPFGGSRCMNPAPLCLHPRRLRACGQPCLLQPRSSST